MKKLKNLNCILLIDDDEIVNFLNTELIDKMNLDVHVEVVLNGKIALDYLTSSGEYSNNEDYPQPGLIFLDINMPLMNGWEFLDEYINLPINQKGQHIVSMLSSSINPDDKNNAISNKYLKIFIKKPLTFEKLNEIVYKFFPEEII